jgi:arsenate reductase (glutaredoxin)
MILIYHNGRCTKSRGALELLIEKGIPHEVRWYMQEPLTKTEIKGLLKKLGIKASALVRRSEPVYKALFSDTKPTEAALIKAMSENPSLIERPIVENGPVAVIARPAERLMEVL